MKLEKRSADMDTSAHNAPQETAPVKKERSHILIYILILFIAAFLLMTLSFLSHQRSNEQMLGQLNINANALENLQTALEENVRLQQQVSFQKLQLEELEKEVEAVQKSLEESTGEKISLQQQLEQRKNELTALQQQMTAMDALSQLQQLFISSDLEACRSLIADMESRGLDKLLPQKAASAAGAAPSQLFQQLKLLTTVPSAGENTAG